MDGIILIDKPTGCTSHDIVHSLRRILGTKKIGHFGTLDPLAEGLLLIGAGKATRLFPFLSKSRKEYEGTIRLGLTTDTYDREGEITSRYQGDLPGKRSVEQAMAAFEGEIQQIPPPYSAKKFQGKPLYVMARNKQPVPLKPCPVTVYSFLLTDFSPPTVRFLTSCSTGTYVRSLAHDLGARLGCGGCLDSLKRTRIGLYHLSEARPLDDIEVLTLEGRVDEFLLPMESLLPDYPSAVLGDEALRMARHGNPVSNQAVNPQDTSPDDREGIVRLFDREGRLIALGRRKDGDGDIHPFLVFHPE